jgi:hypothetical protein
MTNPFDPANHYFLNFDNDEIIPFAVPFCRLMFAYANLDREIARLVSASTGKPSHKDKFRRGSANDLADEFEDFIHKNNGDVLEIEEIKEQLNRSRISYELRNLLAHGHWWEFDTLNMSVSIRHDRTKDDQERFITVTIAQIEEAISKFEDVEIELFKVRRRIESRRLSNQGDIE